jgi:glycosyltransferase involved in cell wall biosynthesis
MKGSCKKKVLIVASVASMIDQFTMPNIELLQKMGCEVHVAANFEEGNTSSVDRVKQFQKVLEKLGVSYYHIGFSRNVTSIDRHLDAYKRVLKLLTDNEYDFIHCHSPIGGVIARLAAHKKKTPVVYTAHGFHFYRGAPLLNWVFYYPIERWLARYTDVLITLNREDYFRAKSFKANTVEYIPGVGIDSHAIGAVEVDAETKRAELGISRDAFLLLSVGELNVNKNHQAVIKAVAEMKDPSVHYVICGGGALEDRLRNLAHQLGVGDRVHLIGFRTDVVQIAKSVDLFVFPSYREGLSLALMEAMATGLPIVCSKIRGNVDLVDDGKGGFLVAPNDYSGFAEKIAMLRDNRSMRLEMGQYNRDKIKQFDLSNVDSKVRFLYRKLLGE